MRSRAYISIDGMSFDLVAPHYRWMEPLLAGRKLQRARTAHLRDLSEVRSVLILGEGPGKFLAAFLQRFPAAQITCVDSSKRMLALAQKRVRSLNLSAASINFIHADALAFSPASAGFDLIVTHFFLDCFRADQLQELIPKLARAAKAGASWLLSDFTIPHDGIQRVRARAIHRLMYTFFRAATKLPARALTPPDPFLRAEGFTLRQRLTIDLGLIHSDLWSR